MFTVIYSFHVLEGKEPVFEKAWHELTEMLYQYEGSMGSRLHIETAQRYIGYAQWPDRETWKNAGSKLPESASDIRQILRESCAYVTTLFELELKDDLLRTQPLTGINAQSGK